MNFQIRGSQVFRRRPDGAYELLSTFNAPVVKVIDCGAGLCALTEPAANLTRIANLFFIKLSGEPIWSASATFKASDKNVFVDAKFDEKNPDQIAVWDWDGNRYVFAISSGQELSRTFMK